MNLELGREGDVETARAVRGGDVAIPAGVRPDAEDGRVTVERLRDELGGTSEGPVPLGPGIASEGILQSQGGVAAVSFGPPDRAVIAIAPTREGAVSLAAAASQAHGPLRAGTPRREGPRRIRAYGALNGGTTAAYHGSFSRVAHPTQPVARGVGMRFVACPRCTVEAQP